MAGVTPLLSMPVYPRVYGERGPGFGSAAQVGGLSPRIRGTDLTHKKGRLTGRFIPAYTGNGGSCFSTQISTSVYPRVYGERPAACRRGHSADGLSPRIRGTDIVYIPKNLHSRFIPAYTGNGSKPQAPKCPAPVYPRVYGERWRVDPDEVNGRGLSPRIRGTVSAVSSGSGIPRFIPAYTGNGHIHNGHRCRWSVYPRVYGERK